MSPLNYKKILAILFAAVLSPFFTEASVIINEAMYDLEGADDDREWVELYNDSDSQKNLSGWKFNDSSNHVLNEPPKNGGKGSLVLPAKGYAVLADNAEKFLSEHQGYGGTLIDTVMSLNNTAGVLQLIDDGGNPVDSFSYDKNSGANGDGKSLQKINTLWQATTPTPGLANKDLSDNGYSSSDSPCGKPNCAEGSALSNESSSSRQNFSQEVSAETSFSDGSRIFADAGNDKVAAAGADIILSGKALGLKKEPLDNARYLWNFGDGSISEGKNVRHFYKYPGDYIAVLDIVSGQYSASDRVNIKIIPNELEILEANDDFIKLRNESSYPLDISGWFLRRDNLVFKFPDSSLVGANGSLVISSDVSKIKGDNADKKGAVDLLYPNGFLAFSYKRRQGGIGQSASVQVIDQSVLDSQTANDAGIKQSSSVSRKNESASSANLTGVTFSKRISSKGGSTQSSSIFYQSDGFAQNNLAGAIAASKENNLGSRRWFVLAVGAGMFGGAGVFLIKRNNMKKSDAEGEING